MTHPDHRTDPWEWALLLLGDTAALATRTDAAVCATGVIGTTRVCVGIERPLPAPDDGRSAEVARRALEIAASTGALLITVLVDGGLELSDAEQGRWLRGAHRLAGHTPRIGLRIGIPTPAARRRLGTADVLVHADGAHEDDAAAARVRAVAALLPENSTVAAPEGPRLAPETIVAPAAEDGAYDLLDALADDTPIVLHERGVVLSLCRIDGQSVAGIASAIGGAADGVDVRATARLLSLCDAFHLPALVVWNAAAETDADAELDALARTIADSAMPLVTLVTGRALGALGMLLTSTALGVREVLAWPHAHIGSRGRHVEVAASPDLDDAGRAALLATRHSAAATRVPGADRVIDPADSLREVHATLARWGTVDDGHGGRRGVLTR